MTVISGYLGAGKTTLINRLLAEPHGLNLTVMVNDFGAINIDQALIARQSKDVIALTNGCVCCTMGADLFMALGDVLDRRPRADHLIVEASGIADPKAIANAAIAEPDMRYGGIVTLVDALNIADLLHDTLIAPQVRQQIAVADLVVQTKRDTRDAALDGLFAQQGLAAPQIMPSSALGVLMLDASVRDAQGSEMAHPSYLAWDVAPKGVIDHARLLEGLSCRPAGLYRLKGFLDTDQGRVDVHVVGTHIDVSRTDADGPNRLVGLGPKDRLVRAGIDAWWQTIG